MLLFNNKTPKKITFNGKTVKELIFNGISIWKDKIVALISGVVPLLLPYCSNENLADYKIHGQCSQSGTPTPDVPIEVECVGDKTRNLFKDDLNTRYKGNWIKADGLFSQSADWCTTDYIKVFGNEFILHGIQSGSMPAICVFDSNKTLIQGYAYSGKKTITISLDQDVYYIRFAYNLTWDLSKVQLEYGTTATKVEPYGYRIPVKVSQDISNLEYELNYYIDNTGVRTYNNRYKCTIEYIPVLPSTEYELYFEGATDSVYITIPFYDNDKKFISRLSGLGTFEVTPKTVKFTTPENCYFMKMSTPQIQYKVTFNQITNIYIDEPLRKISTYADYIDFKNQKVVRSIKAKTFKGTESFTVFANAEFCYNTSTGITNEDSVLIYCTHYRRRTRRQLYDNTSTASYQGCSFNTNYIRFIDNVNCNGDTTLFKDLLTQQYNAGTPVTVYYTGLLTPTEESIVLPDVLLNSGTNIFDTDTTLKPSNVELEYYKEQ